MTLIGQCPVDQSELITKYFLTIGRQWFGLINDLSQPAFCSSIHLGQATTESNHINRPLTDFVNIIRLPRWAAGLEWLWRTVNVIDRFEEALIKGQEDNLCIQKKIVTEESTVWRGATGR